MVDENIYFLHCYFIIKRNQRTVMVRVADDDLVSIMFEQPTVGMAFFFVVAGANFCSQNKTKRIQSNSCNVSKIIVLVQDIYIYIYIYIYARVCVCVYICIFDWPQCVYGTCTYSRSAMNYPVDIATSQMRNERKRTTPL